jgi:hypothetical protein
MSETVSIDERFQGVTGQGQGGHAAGLLAERIDGQASADFFSPIPIGRSLTVHPGDGRFELVDAGTLVLRVRPTDNEIVVPAPATIDEAADAQTRSPVHRHAVVPDCYSCGTVAGTMAVHAGPLSGRPEFATTWTPPAWSADADGQVLDRHVWAATDCPAGWCAGSAEDGSFRLAVTGSMTAAMLGRVDAGVTYAIVAWAGPWKGRRVHAGTALFDAAGSCLAATTSTWIALRC